MKITDFKGIKNTQRLKLKNKYAGPGDEYVFEFDSEGLQWRPGEHGIFSVPNRKVTGKKWRAFSIASIPSDGVVRIATRMREEPSSFKQNLKDLAEGDEIKLRGPFGWFRRMDEASPVVMIAGGIGITPIIAMAKEFQEKPTDSEVTIVYASADDHLFKDELEAAAKSNGRITNIYVHTSEEVDKELSKLISQYKSAAYYYVSGAPAMVKGLSKRITKADVSGRRVIVDPYLGY